MDEEDIKNMVNRFLMWKLRWWPVGTNLFHAEQAKEMIEYMLEGLPSKELSAKESAEQEPVAYCPAYELDRLRIGHGASVRSAKFGPSELDGDVALFITPPTTSAAVAAFRRKAAEVCRESSVGYSRTNHDGRSPVASYKADACDEMAEEIAALPANDSALREVCMRVAKRVYEDARFRSGTVVTLDDAKAIVSGVLDDSR